MGFIPNALLGSQSKHVKIHKSIEFTIVKKTRSSFITYRENKGKTIHKALIVG